MLFDDDALEKIKMDPLGETVAALVEVLERIDATTGGWEDYHYEQLLEIYTLLTELISSGLLTCSVPQPTLIRHVDEDAGELYRYLKQAQAHLGTQVREHRAEQMRQRYARAFGNGFGYEFSDGDLSQLQAAINDLRVQVRDAPFLQEQHRQRLLRRLEKLQAELHKKVSDLDRFWGFVGDAGVVLGKFGSDAKPLADRIKDVLGIVWRAQARAEELPSDAPIPLVGDE